jgi:Ca2+-binding EF-hand superfamily protein
MVGSVGMGGFPPSLSGLGGHKALSFDQADTDGNGSISLEEFTAAAQKLPSPVDSTGSSKASDLFNTIDTNGDGAISKDEATAFQSKISDQIKAMMILFQEQNGTADATTANAGATSPSADDIFAKLDANGDGSISKDEFTAALQNRHHANGSGDRAAKLFDKVDTDGDGSISKDENQAFVDRMQAGHHHRHAWLNRLASQSYTDTAAATTTATDTSAATTESQTV